MKFLHEIFDYLADYDIYRAFSNFNNRFEQFLRCSSLLFKIELDSLFNETFINYSQQVKFHNKHQIFSFNLCSGLYIDDFLSMFIIDSLLNRLESITLRCIKENTLILLLNNFIYLLRLFSLNIQAYDTLFNLISLPIATTSQQISTVKYLVIDHCCTSDHVAIILSYIPEILHLNFVHESSCNSNIEIILPITLSNLTYLSMDLTYLDYDE
ncbi:unnamed protein product, partial [Rotaria sp. Silwood1]